MARTSEAFAERTAFFEANARVKGAHFEVEGGRL